MLIVFSRDSKQLPFLGCISDIALRYVRRAARGEWPSAEGVRLLNVVVFWE